MPTFRVEKSKDYTVMSNYHLRDTSLSLTAKGLLSQMLSLPENWDYTLAGLAQINREGKSAIRSAVKELENAGYVRRRRVKDNNGKFSGNEYIIHESPVLPSPSSDFPTMEKPTLENPSLENPSLENPALEKPSLENRTELNKDICLKENKKEKSPVDPDEQPDAPSRDDNSGDHLGSPEPKPKRTKAEPLSDEDLSDRFIQFITENATPDWDRDVKNALFFALGGFYAPRDKKKQEPSRSPAAITALTNKLLRDSKKNPAVMIDMLERATISGWKSVFPPGGQLKSPPPAKRSDEEWL